MNNFLISIGAIIVVLGVMILVHEWGHFIVARMCGVRVDVFSIGMGPRIWGFQRGPTDYRISILPIGGYVRMAGENPTDERTGAPDEFLSKSRWKRALIILAGPTMNVVAALVFAIAMLTLGRTEPTYLHKAPVVAGVYPDSAAQKAGLQPGDILLKVNGKAVSNWDDVAWQAMFVTPGARLPLVVERDGRQENLSVLTSTSDDESSLLGFPEQAVIVDTVRKSSPAEKAGLEPGDHVVAMDGKPLLSPFQMSGEISKSGGRVLPLTVDRDGKTLQMDIKPAYGDLGDGAGARYYIGIYYRFPTVARQHRFADALRGGVRYNVMLSTEIVHVVLKLVEHKTSVKQLVGPVGIAKASGEAAKEGLDAFLGIMAMVSLNLGILNLLPIPILDGGHLLMLGVEGTLRRDLSLAAKERALQVGLVFLLLLFIVVMYNDVLRLLPGH